MKKYHVLVGVLILVLIIVGGIPAVRSPNALRTPTSTTSTTTPSPVIVQTITMVKLRTQNVTQISVSPPCYNGKVVLNVSSTFSSVYSINIASFLMVVTSSNSVIENSTSVSYIPPSNNLASFLLFPNLPVTLILDFKNVCVPSLSQVILFYSDGIYQFRFSIP